MKEGRKGFTLVELLIVIVVIGILAGMMMLSSTEAVTSAKATKIISDLTVLKKAVISWYADNYERIERKYNNDSKRDDYLVKVGNSSYHLGVFAKDHGGQKEFVKYLGSSNKITLTKDNFTKPGEYLLATEGNEWFVGYDVGSDMRLREKLAGRAKSLKLQGATKKLKSNGQVDVNTDNIHLYSADDQKVYMLILAF
ncbi:MAG: prepilin-type N-terminal cleavage/methylation domain-containing protein [Synergistaceae bacterium]|nr:prepilin-type N-terminal cleavage/methylation domain-containing protein [Synergistaceae bacterium]MBQ6982441.1 prepilin-type N-terminal cleavage/methylation domain-containing protein [Synergistaceae bacterium]